MPPNDFDDFVKRQQTTRELNDFWQKEKDEFLADLNRLYETIKSYLSPYTKDGSISIEDYERSITEENTGTYVAPGLIVKIGRQVVKFEPVGTQLIGAKGRVDVIGTKSKTRIVRVDEKLSALRVTVDVSLGGQPKLKVKNSDEEPVVWAWRIVGPPPTFQYTQLDKDNLMNMLMAVSNG